jgi:hypothetical protein
MEIEEQQLRKIPAAENIFFSSPQETEELRVDFSDHRKLVFPPKMNEALELLRQKGTFNIPS